MSRFWSTLVLAATAVLVVAGCGGSDDSGAPSLSKAEFLQKGNEICSRGNVEVGEAAEKQLPRHRVPNRDELTRFALTGIVPSIERRIDGIDALGAPAGDEDEVDEIVEEARAALDQAKEEPQVLTSQGPGPFAKANQLAEEYGLKACGEG